MILDYINQDYMKTWFKEQLLIAPDSRLSTAIGVIKNNKLICVVLYSGYIESPFGEPIMIEMSVCSIDKSWCTRHNLKEFFTYPFIYLKVKRVQATISKQNKSVRKFAQKLGFKYEGMGRKAYPLGGDAAVYSLLRKECRWI